MPAINSEPRRRPCRRPAAAPRPPRGRPRNQYLRRPLTGGVLVDDAYGTYRAVHRRVAAAVAEQYIDAKALAAAARLLDIGVDGGTGRVLLQSAAEEPPLLDFAMCDVRTGGKTAVHRCIRAGWAKAGGDEEAVRMLDALATSSTSLYEVAGRSPDSGTAELVDLLGSGRIAVADRSLSMGGPAPLAVFLRVLRLGDLNMTSGMAMAFPTAAVPTAISKYEEVAKRSRRRPEIVRFASFFRLYRAYGIAARYAALPETAGA